MNRLISETDLGTKQLFLVLSPPDRLREQNLALTGELLSAGYRVCVITTNYPYRVLSRLYGSAGLDLDRIDFIDAITPYALGSATRYANTAAPSISSNRDSFAPRPGP